MKAIRFHAFGSADVLGLEDIAPLLVGADDVGIPVHSAGVNFVDIRQRQGIYQHREALIQGEPLR